MKQHVTIEQLNELSEKGKGKLRKWWHFKDKQGNLFVSGSCIHKVDGCSSVGLDDKSLPLLSIGQMIEFLNENSNRFNHWSISWSADTDWDSNHEGESSYEVEFGDFNGSNEYELCDALWEAVKEALKE